jgi:hypothetical protein
MLLFDSFFDNKKVINELRKPIVYKPLSNIRDISGNYVFDCKKKWLTTYLDYEIGVELKEKIIPTTWNRITPAKKGEYYIDANVTIQYKNSNTRQNTIHSEGGYGWLRYKQFIVLDRFRVEECQGIKVDIDFIESTINNIPRDTMYFYIKVDARL